MKITVTTVAGAVAEFETTEDAVRFCHGLQATNVVPPAPRYVAVVPVRKGEAVAVAPPNILAEFAVEEARAHDLFPNEDRLPNGTGGGGRTTWMNLARLACDRAQREGRLTHAHVFDEETAEVLAAETDEDIRKELVQVGAMCLKWIRDIDARASDSHGTTGEAPAADGGGADDPAEGKVPGNGTAQSAASSASGATDQEPAGRRELRTPQSTEAPAQAGVGRLAVGGVAPAGFRIIGRSGARVPLPSPDTWVRFGWFSSGEPAGANISVADRFDPPVMVGKLDEVGRGAQWRAGCWDILEPIPAQPASTGEAVSAAAVDYPQTTGSRIDEMVIVRPDKPSTGEAAGAIPAGYRLGDGWSPSDVSKDYFVLRNAAGEKLAGSRLEHAVETGALVPLSPPGEGTVPVCHPQCGGNRLWAGSPMFDGRGGVYCTKACRDAGRPLNPPPVAPPAPVPVEAQRGICLELVDRRVGDHCTLQRGHSGRHGHAPQPAEPAKAPSPRPVSQEAIDHEVAECRAMERKFPVTRPDHTSVVVALADKVAALEAELAKAKRAAERAEDAANRADIASAHDLEKADAARAEVEQLRKACADYADEVEQLQGQVAQAAKDRDRYCSLGSDAVRDVEQLKAKLARAEKQWDGWTEEAARLKREADARVLAAYKECAQAVRGSTSYAQAEERILALIERLPTSTGTASVEADVRTAVASFAEENGRVQEAAQKGGLRTATGASDDDDEGQDEEVHMDDEHLFPPGEG